MAWRDTGGLWRAEAAWAASPRYSPPDALACPAGSPGLSRASPPKSEIVCDRLTGWLWTQSRANRSLRTAARNSLIDGKIQGTSLVLAATGPEALPNGELCRAV